MLKIDASLAELRAVLETEGDAEKRVAIASQIAVLESANALLDARKGKGNETDRGDPKKKRPGNTDDDEDDGDGDEDEDDGEEKKSAQKGGKSKAALAAAPKRKSAKKRADEDEEEDDEEDEDDAAAALATLYQVTGRRGQGAIGALAAMASKALQYDALARDVAALKSKAAADTQSAVITAALAQRRITKPEGRALEGKPASYVAAYLDARPHALVLDDAELAAPKDDLSAVAIPRGAQTMIDQFVAEFQGSDPKTFRAALEASARETVAKSGGRY